MITEHTIQRNKPAKIRSAQARRIIAHSLSLWAYCYESASVVDSSTTIHFPMASCTVSTSKSVRVRFFDDCTNALNSSIWPQVGRAVAIPLSLLVDTSGEQSARLTLNSYSNNTAYMSSFAISQKEVFESVKRVTGIANEKWSATSEPTKQRYEDACESLKKRSHVVFTRRLYTRHFCEDAGLFEKPRKLDNNSCQRRAWINLRRKLSG